MFILSMDRFKLCHDDSYVIGIWIGGIWIGIMSWQRNLEWGSLDWDYVAKESGMGIIIIASVEELGY